MAMNSIASTKAASGARWRAVRPPASARRNPARAAAMRASSGVKLEDIGPERRAGAASRSSLAGRPLRSWRARASRRQIRRRAGVDHAMARHAAPCRRRLRDDIKTVMGFPARSRAGVAVVAIRFVGDLEHAGIQALCVNLAAMRSLMLIESAPRRIVSSDLPCRARLVKDTDAWRSGHGSLAARR